MPSVLDHIKHIPGWLWNELKSFLKSKEGHLIEEIKDLAIPIAEQISHVDINGDGKVAASQEILDVFKTLGTDWAKEFLEVCEGDAFKLAATTPSFDIKRYLSVARLVSTVGKSMGSDKIPALRILNGIVEIAANKAQVDPN